MQDLSDMMARVKPAALEKALSSLDWSLDDLWNEAGVSRNIIRELKKEKPLAAVQAESVADALEQPIEELFDLRERRIKRVLQEYSDDRNYLAMQLERLRMMQEKIGPGSQNLSGMPHSNTNSTSDKTGDTALRIVELEEDIADLQATLAERRKQIRSLIRKLENREERTVIEARYFDDMEWLEVCRMIYGKNKDYKRAEEMYMQKTYKLHGAAIFSMEQLVE